MSNDKLFREHLVNLLTSEAAHVDFTTAANGLPADLQGKRPKGAAHSPWELLEHMRIAQRDLLETIRDPAHQSPEFPDGYWPGASAPHGDQDWHAAVAASVADQQALIRLIAEPSTNLFAPAAADKANTVLQKILLVADHNAYHLGQLTVVRRLLGAWS